WSVCTSTPYILWRRRSSKALRPFSGDVYGWVFCAKNWQLLSIHLEQDARMRQPFFDIEMLTVYGHAPIVIRCAGQHRLHKLARQFVLRVKAALRRAEHLHGHGGEPLILEEPLMGRGVVGLDEELMQRLSRDRRPRQGKLVII